MTIVQTQHLVLGVVFVRGVCVGVCCLLCVECGVVPVCMDRSAPEDGRGCPKKVVNTLEQNGTLPRHPEKIVLGSSIIE